ILLHRNEYHEEE
ncbi:unnamed protein product, partial [Rotaria sp. Silwood2]